MMVTTDLPARAVLQGVPRVHFWEGGPRCPEDICFPSVMRAVMEYLRENIGCQHCPGMKGKSWGLRCSYSYFMVVSGMAFAINWKPGWGSETFAMLDSLSTERDEPFRRAFEAVGYGFEYILPEMGEDYMREKIRASIIERQRPVISFGIVGPPEAGLITGYDEGGSVLLGWSFFQNFPGFATEIEPNSQGEAGKGYYRKRGWFPETQGLLVVGDKGPEPNQEEIFIKALKWSLELAQRPEIRGMPYGLAAYDAWSADLLEDDCFPTRDEAALRQRFETHNFMVGQIAEMRWYGAVGLMAAVEKLHYKHAEQVLKAAGCYAGEHEMMWKLWDLAGGNGNPDGWQKLADPAVRRQMAQVVKESQAKYSEAAGYIEETLKKL